MLCVPGAVNDLNANFDDMKLMANKFKIEIPVGSFILSRFNMSDATWIQPCTYFCCFKVER